MRPLKVPPEKIITMLTQKKPGLLTLSHSWGSGGGGSPPPLRISAAKRPKIMKFGTYVNHVETRRIVSRNFHTENQSGFQIMQIYVNFMHVYIFNYIQ